MVKSSVSETAVEFRYYGKREFGGIIQDQKKELVKWREYSGMGGRLPGTIPISHFWRKLLQNCRIGSLNSPQEMGKHKNHMIHLTNHCVRGGLAEWHTLTYALFISSIVIITGLIIL